MSNDLTKQDADARVATAGRRRRALWVATGVAGLTGIVGLAALGGGVVRHDTNETPGVERVADDYAAEVGQDAEEQAKADGKETSGETDEPGGQDPGGGNEWNAEGDESSEPASPGWEGEPADGKQPEAQAPGGKEGKKGKEGKEWGGNGRDQNNRDTEVPCDSDRLIQAIIFANSRDGGTIRLASGCTYSLTASNGTEGLPPIVQTITIKGKNSTIFRAANAAQFRIFTVNAGGRLTLDDVTVKGGQDIGGVPGGGGGGVLVRAGGTAVLNRTTLVNNTTTGGGGGLANQGTTTLNHSAVVANTANLAGGGINNAGLLKVNESKIEYNNAGLSGGGGIANTSVALINKSSISHNRTIGSGGGLLAVGGITTLTHSKLIGNNAAINGGGVFTINGTLTLRHVTVAKNAAILSGAGLELSLSTQATVEHSVVKNNTGGLNGAGIHNITLSTLTLRDSEVSSNQGVGPTSQGAGIYNSNGTVTITRSKVTNNTATVAPGGIYTGNNQVTLDDRSAVIGNRPTNCAGSPVIPTNCFG